MKFLLTAGSTLAPLDRHRALLSTVLPRVSAKIARAIWNRGHELTILTSTGDALAELPEPTAGGTQYKVESFRTTDDLLSLLPQVVKAISPDVIVHTAAIPEFVAAGVYSPMPGTFFNARTRQWEGRGGPPGLYEPPAGAPVEDEQWIRLVKAPRIVERLKSQWNYAGLLVAYRIEREMRDPELLVQSEAIRNQLGADLIATTTVEGEANWAYLGPVDGGYQRLTRRELPEQLLYWIEQLQRAKVNDG
jgi:hypothetical protein